jgi:hypothetical protein
MKAADLHNRSALRLLPLGAHGWHTCQPAVRMIPPAMRLALPRHNCFDHGCWVSIDK